MDKPLCMDIKTYEQAVRWLYDRIDYERIRPSGQSNPFRLERVEQLLMRIGSPHRRIKAVHIAGTKGKGSTAAMLDSVLRESGLRVGLFTSPHIASFEERMRVNGMMPNQAQLISLVCDLQSVMAQNAAESTERPPTFFEITTLLAWMFFDRQRVDIAILETGLGGRLDCTNVCDPLVTIITSIGLDHTHILGDTLEKIASEKAGIIKPGVPVIQGMLPAVASRVVESAATKACSRRYCASVDFDVQVHDRGIGAFFNGSVYLSKLSNEPSAEIHQQRQSATFRRTDHCDMEMELEIPFAGQHQARNAALVVQTALLLKESGFQSITNESIQRGIQSTFWPLRFEILEHRDKTVIVDAAHNPDSISAVIQCLKESVWHGRSKTLIFASSADKDWTAMLQLVSRYFNRLILTRFVGNPRSVSPVELKAKLHSLRSSGEDLNVADLGIVTTENPGDALQLAANVTEESGLICATGSLFLAAEVRALICGNVSPFPVFADESEN